MPEISMSRPNHESGPFGEVKAGRMVAVQSPIIPTVAEWIRQHPGTISLGQGVVNYGPPEAIHQKIREFFQDAQNHKYKPVQGQPELLEVLTEKLARENGIPMDASRALVVPAGANQAFMNALLSITDSGDEVILQTPYYFNQEMAVTMAGCRPVLVPTDPNYQLQPDRIREAVTPRTRAVVTISPNNPSGAVYPAEDLREVNSLCREKGLYHIHDEAYEYFVYDQARHVSPGSFEESAGHTILLFSLSKAYGFASWRIGYMVFPASLLGAVRKIQDTILICPPVISQYAALGALSVGSAYCREKLPQITEVRQIVQKELQQLGDLCQVPRADGAFYFLLRLARPLDPLKLTEDLIRKHGVAVIPGNAFGLDRGCHLRVAYGTLNRDTAQAGVGRLVKGLRELAGKQGGY